MPDATITVANVGLISGPSGDGKGGETITRGQVLRKGSTDSEYYLADADAAGEATVVGIALTDGYDGKDLRYAKNGATINVGFTTTQGERYYLSDTPGSIKPSADLSAGDVVVLLFVGSGTADVTLTIINSGRTVQ